MIGIAKARGLKTLNIVRRAVHHEPYVAVARFQRLYLRKGPQEIESRLMERGHGALSRMQTRLGDHDWIAGGAGPSLADLALVAYTRVVH